MKLSEIVLQQSYKLGSKSHILSCSCINLHAAFSISFTYRTDCSFCLFIHSKGTNHDLHYWGDSSMYHLYYIKIKQETEIHSYLKIAE
jgi:hypothetical protein